MTALPARFGLPTFVPIRHVGNSQRRRVGAEAAAAHQGERKRVSPRRKRDVRRRHERLAARAAYTVHGLDSSNAHEVGQKPSY